MAYKDCPPLNERLEYVAKVAAHAKSSKSLAKVAAQLVACDLDALHPNDRRKILNAAMALLGWPFTISHD